MKWFALSLALVLGVNAAIVPLTLAWDPNPSDQQVSSYQIYASGTVTGNWTLVAVVAGSQTNWTLQIDNSKPAFFYVTASNFWGESSPSNITNSPSATTKVENPQLHR